MEMTRLAIAVDQGHADIAALLRKQELKNYGS